MIGTTAACPRCGKPTELLLATPAQESGLPRRVIVYTVTGILILLLGLAGSVWALKRAQAMAERQKQKAGQTTTP